MTSGVPTRFNFASGKLARVGLHPLAYVTGNALNQPMLAAMTALQNCGGRDGNNQGPFQTSA